MAKEFRQPCIVQDFDAKRIRRKHVEYVYRFPNDYGAIVRISKDKADAKFAWDLDVVYFTAPYGDVSNYFVVEDAPISSFHFGLTDDIVSKLLMEIESWC